MLCTCGFLISIIHLKYKFKMKISERQLLVMFDILKHSTRFVGDFGGYDVETRNNLLNDIINQQSNDLVDVKTE